MNAFTDASSWEENLGIINTKGEAVAVKVTSRIEVKFNKIVRYYGTFQNISEQKNQQTKLIESENRFRHMIENAKDYAVFTIDKTGHIVTWNENAQNLKGYKSSEILGSHMSIFYPQDINTLGRCEEELKIATNFGRFEEEAWRFRKDGSKIWVNIIIGRLNDENGNLIGFTKMTKDLTYRKEMEKNLQIAQDRFDFVANGIKEGIFELNTLNGQLFLSKVGRQIQGAPEELDISLEFIENLMNPEDRVRIRQIRSDYLLRKIACYDVEYRIGETDNPNPKWINARAIAEWNDEGTPVKFVGSVRDITEKKQTEILLHNSAKMASLGEMAAGVAHEINNPLTIITSKTEQLIRAVNSESIDIPKIKQYAESISSTVRRISRIVKGLSTFARDGSNDKFELVSITELIENSIGFCKARFENSGVSFEIINNEIDLQIECQAVQISQILVNLLNNAFDAVNLTQNPKVQLTVVALQNEYIEISVVDSGGKISDEIANKIMQPFFMTKEVGKGTGLGLSISKGIAQSHNGDLFFDKNFKTTCFVLRLPYKQELSKEKAL